MRKVELTKGISSSVLGFGCAPVLGAVNAKMSKYTLDYAIDHGINHLDLARSYGFGEAEKLVGTVIAGKRDKLVLASKFGIKPNWKAALLNTIKPVVRMLKGIQAKPNAEADSNAKNMADNFLERIVPLRGKDMRSSLEKSLKALRTDQLDYFFIHEPHRTIGYIDELKETAALLKAEGKIRAWGIAYMQTQQHLHDAYLHDFDLLQFNKPIDQTSYNHLIEQRSLASNIFFSPIKGGGSDLTPSEKIKQLFKDFPESVILCSMFNLDHLKQNIQLAQ